MAPFFKKDRSGMMSKMSTAGMKKGKGKKTQCDYGRQYHILGNPMVNGKIPITKKASAIIN